MTTDELRAKFELLPCPWCGEKLKMISVSEGSTFRWRKIDGCCTDGPEVRHDTLADDQTAAEADSYKRAVEAWNTRAHDSRDAEIEALRKDAERWRSLVAENNKGPHGKFRICWLDPSHEGFITTDGVSCNGKDEAAIVRIFDAAMRKDV